MSSSHTEIMNIANHVFPRLKERFKLEDVSINRSTARSVCGWWEKKGLVKRVDRPGERGINIPLVFEKINVAPK